MKIQAFDFSVDLMRALLWQYNDAARLQSLLEQKQAWYDLNQQGFWDDWVRDVFDLRTANDFGLSVWAVILNAPLVIVAGGDGDKPIWGFAADDFNFTNGNFANTQTSGLTTAQKRLVLRMRYFQLVTRGAVTEVNAFMNALFADDGLVWVVDGLNMKARYVFDFPLPRRLRQVFTEFDLLPRPAGVKVDFIVLGETGGWGFGAYRTNFNNGNFYHA
jgi:hypothetical protein